MKNSTIKIYIFPQKNKKGEYPVTIRITEYRQSKYIQTGYYVTAQEKEKFKNGISDKYKYWNEIQQKIKEVTESKTPTQQPKITFTSYFEEYLNELHKKNKFGQKQKMSSLYYHLKNFTEFKIIKFEDINLKFLKDFQLYFIEKKLQDITQRGYFDALRATLYRIQNKDKVHNYKIFPFDGFDIPKAKQKKPKSLTTQEFIIVKDTIYNDTNLPDKIKKAGLFWLFCYFANGTRFSDAITIKWDDIKQNEFIVFNMYKTKTLQQIYLNDELVKIICLFNNLPINRFNVILNSINKDKEKRIFDYLPLNLTPIQEFKERDIILSRMNQNLYRLADYINTKHLQKIKLSTHVARHTFSYIQLTENKSDVFTISNALKHADLKTTNNYLSSFNDEKLKDEFYKTTVDGGSLNNEDDELIEKFKQLIKNDNMKEQLKKLLE